MSLPEGISLVAAGDLALLRLDFLTEGTGAHAYFTTRRGGVSDAPYATLNVGLHVGDDPDRVRENRQRVWSATGLAGDRAVGATQVHGRHVHRVRLADAGCGAFDSEGAIPETDALVTAEPGLALTAYYADCVPILLLDPVAGAGGVAHAGWKGTVLQVAGEAVRAMAAGFGARADAAQAERVRAVIGPSIGPCCYEVDERVAGPIRESYPAAAPVLLTPTSAGHAHLNLWEANRQALLAAGLRPENVLVSGLCTACHTDWFFSHRAEAGHTGRMMAVLSL
ncbi:MAG: peptidoglycan editing factor PgeF [Symbiobacteriia bacterium]